MPDRRFQTPLWKLPENEELDEFFQQEAAAYLEEISRKLDLELPLCIVNVPKGALSDGTFGETVWLDVEEFKKHFSSVDEEMLAVVEKHGGAGYIVISPYSFVNDATLKGTLVHEFLHFLIAALQRQSGEDFKDRLKDAIAKWVDISLEILFTHYFDDGANEELCVRILEPLCSLILLPSFRSGRHFYCVGFNSEDLFGVVTEEESEEGG